MQVRRRVLAGAVVTALAVTGVAVVASAAVRGRDPLPATDRTELVHGSGQTTAPSATCTGQYTVTAHGGGRFTAALTVATSVRLGSWRLSWTYPGGQRVRRLSGAPSSQVSFTQVGAAVRVRAGDGTPLTPGRSLRLTLAGRYGAGNPAPTGFALNGTPCRFTTSATPLPTTTSTTTPTRTASTTAKPTTSTTAKPTTGTTTKPTTSTTPSTSNPPGGVLGAGRIQFGRVYTGDGTYYGATGAGNCMFDAGGDLMVVAMNQADYENSQACGAHLQVTGPKGSVTVKVVDRCPECRPGDLDLSQQAFAAIADPVAGRVTVSWKLLSPALAGPIAYRYKEGSSQWWCGIQIRNHRNPVRSVEALVGGTWRQLPRQEYNYFVSADGSGCGGSLRVTDIYGNQVTDAKVPVVVGAVQPGSAQFGPPR